MIIDNRMQEIVMPSANRFLKLWIGWIVFSIWLGIHSALGAERGLLWKIESANVPASYLFGTIHADDARVTNFSPELMQAMRQTKSFMMETLPAGDLSAIFMKQGSLRDLLRPEEVEQLLKLADRHAMRDDVALRMKPWLLASVFALPWPQSPLSQDVLLFGMANDYGMELLGLEDADEHFGALDSLSDKDQLTLLRAVLAQSQQQKEQAFEAVLQAYLNKEIERIATEDEKWSGMVLPKELWAEVKSRLLDQRNERMAQRIAKQAAASPVFIAVGAAHLSGEGGLISRLRKAGFTLSAIQ